MGLHEFKVEELASGVSPDDVARPGIRELAAFSA